MTALRRGPAARAAPIAAFTAVCYLPFLLTQPGWVSADTKSYLYLDPGRLLSKAWSSWDPTVGLGTVTHQSVGYLWPMGPWYWLFDRLGVPDWVAQRLWWGTLLFAAGAGVAHLLRRTSWPPVAVWTAACTYALTPYVLTHLERLSAVLLPFVALPWLLSTAASAARRGGWRHPAAFALLVATCGSVNLTALVLVLIGPAAWFATCLVRRDPPRRQVLAAAGRIAALTVPVSAWWIAGLSVQASHGLDVVRYSETAEIVTTTSSATEVLRGLGYWFFYGGDRLEPWVASGPAYTQRPWLLALSFAVPVLAVASASVLRWRHRPFAVGLLVVGVVLAVGAHPWADPTPVGRAIKALLETERGLALRSLPRAVPLVALGLGLLLGAGVAAGWLRLGRARPVLLLVPLVPVLALAPLWQGDMVSPGLRRQEVPDHWRAAIAVADAGGHATRVLALPGADFAYYDWGVTIDPVTPGLTDRPFAARELVPHGTPAAADLLRALDERLQQGTLDRAALAPLARLLRAGVLLVRSDLQHERFGLVTPAALWRQLDGAPGLGAPRPFGPPAPTPADAAGERAGAEPAWRRPAPAADHPPPAVALVPVEEPVPLLSVKDGAGAVLLAGDGEGVVDAAAAGVLDGSELVRYGAAIHGAARKAAVEEAGLVVVTDTNRRRAERWRTIHDTRGFTETAAGGVLADDASDNRLPVFPEAEAGDVTLVEHRGGLSVRGTAYGDVNWYATEWRPAAAADGDPHTAWRVAPSADARGHRLQLELDEPRPIDRLRLLQPAGAPDERRLTQVAVRIDAGPPLVVDLDVSSTTAPGQLVTFPEVVGRRIAIEVLADTAGDRPRYIGLPAVGFAEVRVDDDASLVVQEVVRVADGILRDPAVAHRPLSIVLTRLRRDPAHTGRQDEEPALARAVRLTSPRTMAVHGTARLSHRAPDDLVESLLAPPAGGPPSALDTGCRDDLLLLDGQPVPLRVHGDSAAARRGDPLRVEGCTPARLAAGDHLLEATAGARSGMDLDQLVLEDPAGPGRAAGTRPGDVRVVREGQDHVDVELPGGVDRAGRWLVLGQSHSPGWSARLDGTDLGPPQLVDGFANGWPLPPGTDPVTITLRFEPQRRVDLGLAVSAASGLLALALLLCSRPAPAGPARGSGVEFDVGVRSLWRAERKGRAPRGGIAGVALVVTALAALLVELPLAALAGGLAALALRHPAAALALRLAPAALVAAAAGYVLVGQVRHHVPHGIEWPGELGRGHALVLLALVLLVAREVVERALARRAGDGPPTDS